MQELDFSCEQSIAEAFLEVQKNFSEDLEQKVEKEVSEYLTKVLGIEADLQIGAEWYERTMKRIDYRAGYRERTVITPKGTYRLKVPKARSTPLRFTVFNRYERLWKQVDKIAFERFEKCLRAISIASDIKYSFEFDPREIRRVNGKPTKMDYELANIFISVPMFSERVHIAELVHDLLEKTDPDDAITNKLLEYYLGGLTLQWIAPTQHTWTPEAFLNYFKVIELAADQYRNELKNRLQGLLQTESSLTRAPISEAEINQLLTTKRKVEFMCRQLEMDEHRIREALESVDLRNRFDVAHPTAKRNVKVDDLTKCREVAKLVLIKYLGALTQSTHSD